MYSNTFLCQINVTRDCNLRCEHCYISTDAKVASQYMNKEQFKTIIDQLCDFLESRQDYQMADVHVIGGEPSLLGEAFFDEVIPYAESKFKDISQEVKFSIVTNLLTRKAVKVAKKFRNIATSYEVDTRFITVSHKAKPELELKWIDNCQSIMREGRELGITMAMTKQAIEKGAANILNYLYEIGFRKMHFGFFIPSGDGMKNISTVFPRFEETTQFLKETTDWYLEKRKIDPEVIINPVESMINSISKGEANDDIICPIIPGSLDIDWDGKTVTCIEAGGELGFESMGNVFESDIQTIMKSPAYRKERRKALKVKPHCLGCDELNICSMACGILHDFWNGEGECPGFKGFIKNIRHEVEFNNVKPKS